MAENQDNGPSAYGDASKASAPAATGPGDHDGPACGQPGHVLCAACLSAQRRKVA